MGCFEALWVLGVFGTWEASELRVRCLYPLVESPAQRSVHVDAKKEIPISNTRRRILGHHLVSNGTLDTTLVHPREVFRAAVIIASAALILAHNHPSGDPTPSEADIKVTRDLIRAGQLIKIEVLDHVIIGKPTPERIRDFASLRELGHFAV
jgi:DNA repair protein RadC